MTQSERYVHPDDDLISDEKVQAKYHAEKKCDRVRKTKIKQDKIIDNMRLELMGSFGFLLADLWSAQNVGVLLLIWGFLGFLSTDVHRTDQGEIWHGAEVWY